MLGKFLIYKSGWQREIIWLSNWMIDWLNELIFGVAFII